MINRKNTMKLGYEVEGRLKGLYTLFLSAKEAKEFFEFSSLKERAVPKGSADSIDKVQHIYISDMANIIGHLDYCLYRWQELGLNVTLEVTEVRNRASYPKNVSFMLHIATNLSLRYANSFFELAGTDQIKFAEREGNAHLVYCVTKENMTKTWPSDFENDIEFSASQAKKFLASKD